MKKVSAKTLDTALRNHYDKQSKYMVSNIYGFHDKYHETDFLVVKSNNEYCYDVEIKVNRGDFFRDFHKLDKHTILKKGYYKVKRGGSILLDSGKRKRVKKGDIVPTQNSPHRFYYAVPTNLISADDVPEYAGLLYIDSKGNVTKVKEGKLLHKKPIDIEKMLCRKFYFRWLNTITANEIIKKQLKICEKQKK